MGHAVTPDICVFDYRWYAMIWATSRCSFRVEGRLNLPGLTFCCLRCFDQGCMEFSTVCCTHEDLFFLGFGAFD